MSKLLENFSLFVAATISVIVLIAFALGMFYQLLGLVLR